METTKKPFTEYLRDIFELENTVKNTLVLIVNYQNELWNRSISKKQDISIFDLDFKEIRDKHLMTHKMIMEKIEKNYNLIKEKEVKNE